MTIMDDDEKTWMKERRAYIYALAIMSYACGLLITYEILGSGRPMDWTSILVGSAIGVAIVAAIKAIKKKSCRTQPDRLGPDSGHD
jgi:glucose uptake protein GlcU